MDGTSKYEDEKFAAEIKSQIEIPTTVLETAIDWIAKNLIPSQVFPDKDLDNWAENNGYKKE